MKTFNEAIQAVLYVADPNSDRAAMGVQNVVATGREIVEDRFAQIYVTEMAAHHVKLPGDKDMQWLICFGLSCMTAGVQIGIEMEKPGEVLSV